MSMSDSLKLSERLLRQGPWLTSLALTALIALEIAQASMSLFDAPRPIQSDPHRPLWAIGHEQIDFRRIVAAHLFGSVVDPGTQAQTATTANLALTGTLATQDPSHGAAIITSDEGPSRVYSVGQDVDGALLRSVYVDHVLLDRSGALETLRLRKPVADANEPTRSATLGGVATLTAQAAASSDQPNAQGSVLQLARSPIGLGSTHGFRVAGSTNLAALRNAGLRPNDIVTAVDGTPLDDYATAQYLIDQTLSGPAVITVMRGGRPIELNVNSSD
jgi:general secretion pathway protein C